MNDIDTRVIALSRKKMLLIFFGACAFVIGGLWMLQLDAAQLAALHRPKSPALAHGIGAISVAFFGLIALLSFKKLFDQRPGLILSGSGLTDNSSGVSAGFIPWSEIAGVDTFQVFSEKMLVVKVHHPERYIMRGGSFRRSLNRANFKLCGSPIAITPNSLEIDFDELLAVCQSYFEKYRAPV